MGRAAFRVTMAATVGILLAGCASLGPQQGGASKSDPVSPSSSQAPDIFGSGVGQSAGVVRFRIDYPVDVADQPRLAGFADAVFVASVRSSRANQDSPTPSRTLDLVVHAVLKGALKNGDITSAVQLGGFKGRELYIPEGDNLCDSGKTYLFAATSSGGTFNVIARYGDVPVRDVDDPKVEFMREAVAKQVPYR